jgi:hypothetical protein
MQASGSAATVVTEYLDAFYTGDFAQARALVEDGFSFSGPFVEVDGRDAFFASADGLRRIVRGHRLLAQWADGADVCSIFDLALETPAGAGSVAMSEWHTVRDGRLVAGRVLFDTAAFRALLPAAP